MTERTFKKTYGIKSRIEPTPRQIQFLQRNFGCARKVYNLLVEEGNKRDAEAIAWHEEDPEGRANQEYPYEWRSVASYNEEYPYLQEADTRATKNARRHYHAARSKHFTENTGRPTFKSKWDYPRAYTTDNQNYKGPGTGTIRVTRHHGKDWLHIPKLPKNHVHNTSEKTGKKLKQTHIEDDDIRIILSRPITDAMRINTATISQEADGSYYASLNITETITTTCDTASQEATDPRLLASLCFGGDLGLKSYLVGSDGVSYDDPADYGYLEDRLRREQRKLGKQQARLKKQGRCLSECRNYQRQKRRVAKIARKIARKREDFRHKLSRQLVDSYDLIALEDLHVAGMLRNHHLAKAVSESAWSDFIKKVRYKAEWEGKTVVLVGQWFPSTRTCSCCGAKTGPHGVDGLGVRFWVCPECGAHHNRDGNASWNVLLEGLRIVASGDGEMASVWGRVRELVLARHRESFDELVGRVALAPTDGTSGVAWGKDDGAGPLALESYPGVYTESAVDSFGGHQADLGEPGISKNSAENLNNNVKTYH